MRQAERPKEWKVADWMERRFAAYGALPTPLREIAYTILRRDERPHPCSVYRAKKLQPGRHITPPDAV